jgi:hypothetical protein
MWTDAPFEKDQTIAFELAVAANATMPVLPELCILENLRRL